MINKPQSYTNQFLVILFVKSLFILMLILFADLGLGPDEAQYWTWSKVLDFGYYSKPPGIAWQIKIGTGVFGDTELGVRFLSIILSFLQAFAIYKLALISNLSSRTAFWCGIVMAFCPIGIFGSIFAITDAGLLLFWTFACLSMIYALKRNEIPNSISIGLFILGGALFKWSIYLFWVYAIIFYFLNFSFKSWYKQFFQGVSISLLGLLPSVWWNWSHDWATFRHVSSTLQGGHGSNAGNFFEFIGSQALLFSPIFFGLLILAYKECLINFRSLRKEISFSFIFSFLSLLVFSLVSIFQKMQGNWILFTYPTAIILVGWYCESQIKNFKWIKWGLVLNLILMMGIFLWPSFVNYRKSPFKHNLGWMELQNALHQQGYDSNEHFLVSDKYQNTSLLSFYNLGQKRAYFLNLGGSRKNQFSYWPTLQEKEKGKSGYFVWIENAPHLEKKWQERREYYLTELSHYFNSVSASALIPLIIEKGEVVKGALMFKCEFCKDVQPIEFDKY